MSASPRLLCLLSLVSAAVATAGAQTTEQRLWRVNAGLTSGRGDELLSAAYEPGPELYAAVDFVSRGTRMMRSIGYFVSYARYSYDDGAFWTLIRNSSGSTGAPILEGASADLAALGAVGKVGPIYGKLRPYGSISLALFRNNRRALTTAGLNPGETQDFPLGSKSGLQTGVSAGADFMGRRFGVNVDAGSQANWTGSRLDKRFQVCDGDGCRQAAGSSRTVYVRVGVALVRGSI